MMRSEQRKTSNTGLSVVTTEQDQSYLLKDYLTWTVEQHNIINETSNEDLLVEQDQSIRII